MREYICIRRKSLDNYLNQKWLKAQKATENSIKKFIYYYEDMLLEKYIEPHQFIKVTFWNEPKEKLKGFVDITGIEIYQDEQIEKGSILATNIILEGSDGVGKTSTIEGLIKYGIICQDRSTDIICKYMLLDIPMKERCEAYRNYLENNDMRVIFLVNHNKKEINRRINSREKISEFDKLANEYNELYWQTYKEMSKYNLNNPIYLVDCTDLTLEQQIKAVKKVIENI